MFWKISSPDFKNALKTTKPSSSNLANFYSQVFVLFSSWSQWISPFTKTCTLISFNLKISFFPRSDQVHLFIQHEHFIGFIALELATRMLMNPWRHFREWQTNREVRHFVNERFPPTQVRPYNFQLLLNALYAELTANLQRIPLILIQWLWMDKTALPIKRHLLSWCIHWKQNRFLSILPHTYQGLCFRPNVVTNHPL